MTSETINNSSPARRWLRRLLIVLALLGGVLFLAPSIVARTGLRQTVLDFAGTRLGVRIHLDDLQLGWLSAVRVGGLRVETPAGQPLLQAKSIATQLPLWKLAWKPRQFGEIRAEGLLGQVHVREGGSSWEDLLRAAVDQQQPPSGKSRGLPQGQVLVRDAALQVTLADDPRVWEMRISHAEAVFDTQAAAPVRIMGETEIEERGGGRGQLRWEARLLNGQASEGLLRLRAEGLPLSCADAALRRLGSRAACQGAATAALEYQWADGFASHHARIEPGSVVEAFQLAAPQYLGEEVLQLQRVSLSGEAEMLRDSLRVRQLQLDSDIGRAVADGELQLPQFRQALATGRSDQALSGAVSLNGTVQLAELARRLPQTLHMRADAEITAGQLDFEVRGAPADIGSRWTGRVRTQGLQGVTAGRRASLQSPVSLEITAEQKGATWSVSQLAGRASFLQCDGGGDLQAGALRASADLQQLHAELAQFVDLSDVRLAGTIDAQIDWRRLESQRVQLQGTATLREVQAELPGYAPLHEPELRTVLHAVAVWDDALGKLVALESARAEISAAGDRLQCDLLQPADLTAAPHFAVSWSTNGDLDHWMRRTQPLLRMPGWSFRGNVQGNGKLVIAAEMIQVDAAQVEFQPLLVHHAAVRIDEPRVQFNTSGVISLADAVCRLGSTTLVSSSIAARTDNLTAAWKADGAQLRADVSFRGDLGRLQAMFPTAHDPSSRQVLGQLEGQVSLLLTPEGLGFDARQTVKPLAFAQREARPQGPQSLPASVSDWKTIWSEPEVRIAAQGTLAGNLQQLQLARLSAAADGIELTAHGGIDELTSLVRLDVQGELSYDLSRLVSKLRNVLGASVQVEGSSSRPFSVQGPLLAADAGSSPGLAPPQLTASGGVGWDRANLAGVEIGPGQVQATLSQGFVQCEPVAFDVVQGRLQMTPAFDLRGPTPRLTLQPGRVAEGLTITPQMCQTWLKFVAPLVADATAVQGVFSADLAQFDLPVSDLRDATIEGRVILQEARIGPGPLSQQFLQIAQQVESIIKGRAIQRDPSQWLTLPPQEVQFALRQGRVAHRGLRMRIDELEIRTQGDVGLDQSLALMAEVILPASWIGDKKVLSGLPNGAIQIPIRGTLQRPQVDRAALTRLGQQLVSGAAQGLIQGELDKALKKLFK